MKRRAFVQEAKSNSLYERALLSGLAGQVIDKLSVTAASDGNCEPLLQIVDSDGLRIKKLVLKGSPDVSSKIAWINTVPNGLVCFSRDVVIEHLVVSCVNDAAVMRAAGCTIERMTLEWWSGDGVKLCADDLTLRNVEARGALAVFPYDAQEAERMGVSAKKSQHPDLVQGYSLNGMPLDNITVDGVRYRRGNHRWSNLDTLQGVMFTESSGVTNSRISNIDIQDVVPEHGARMEAAQGCIIENVTTGAAAFSARKKTPGKNNILRACAFPVNEDGSARVCNGTDAEPKVDVQPHNEVSMNRKSTVFYDRKTFYDEVRHSLFGGSLKQGQVDGVDVTLRYWERKHAHEPAPWLAYCLATEFHETAQTMQPIKEYGSAARFMRMYDKTGDRPHVARDLGNVEVGDGAKFCGRGKVQNTGRCNYEKQGRKLGVDLVGDPDLLCRDPDLAAANMIDGMIDGDFTGRGLPDYGGYDRDFDPIRARAIVNGKDKRDLIAGYYYKFLNALEKAREVQLEKEKVHGIEPPVQTSVVEETGEVTTSYDAKPGDPGASRAIPAPRRVSVETKPRWKSKLVWTGVAFVASGLSTAAAHYGVDIPAETISKVLMGEMTIGGIAVVILRAFFTKKVLS